MMWSRGLAVALGVVCVLRSGAAVAALPGDCSGLGVAITEHSCFHSEFGPFTTVMATAGSATTRETADVSPVHTEYRVGLTGEYSVVTYTPRRTGTWAILLGEAVPLVVLAGEAEALESVLNQSGDTGCAALPVLHVYQLAAETRYRLVLGPTAARTVTLVVEYIDDFLTENGLDHDGDGYGSDAEVVVTPCRPPAGFAPNTRDCNDEDDLISPAASEVCDGLDQNCNGVADDVGLACRVGAGACRTEGLTVCGEPGASVSCSRAPASGGAELCNGIDDDCNGRIDDAPGLCTEPTRPTCVRKGMTASCGCLLDIDCGSQTSGRICNVAQGVCEDGCSASPGRNGCKSGEACDASSERCHATSEGGAPGVSGAGAPGNAAGAPREDEGGSPGELERDRLPGTTGGCGCRVIAARGTSGGLLFVLGALACLARRRGKAALSAAVAAAAVASLAALLAGCGGRVQGDAPSITGGGSWGDPAGSGGHLEQPDLNGGAGFAAAGCEPELGDHLIEHACSHATNGPFVKVAAGEGVKPPDVSDLHHTYDVQIIGARARLRYRAQRSGEHAFMTDKPTELRPHAGGEAVGARPSFGVEGCRVLERATVVELEAGHEYDLELVASASRFQLFVEHLAAFGQAAWRDACDER